MTTGAATKHAGPSSIRGRAKEPGRHSDCAWRGRHCQFSAGRGCRADFGGYAPPLVYLIIGGLVLAIIVLGVYLYREKTKPAGVELRLDQNGVREN